MSFAGPGNKKIIVIILGGVPVSRFLQPVAQTVSVRYLTYPSARSAAQRLNLAVCARVGEPRRWLRPAGCRQRKSLFALDLVSLGVGVIERQLLAGQLRARGHGPSGPGWLQDWLQVLGRRQRGEDGRIDVLWRIKIMLHQEHPCAPHPKQRVGHRFGFGKHRAPACKVAGQYLQRQYRRCDLDKALVRDLCASRGGGFPEDLTKARMLLDEISEIRAPKHVWQAAVAVDLMIALDQAPTLRREGGRQRAEIERLRPGT
jgi:hypothetical protein